jgi:hypothetical protein
MLLALIVGIIYPGRKVEDLVWALLPMWFLAAREFTRYKEIPKEGREAFLGTMFLLILLAIFLFLNFAGMANNAPGGEIYQERLIISGIVVLLGLVATLLISAGWNRMIALNAMFISIGVLTMFWLFAQSSRISRNHSLAANDLWGNASVGGQKSLFEATLQEISTLNYGRESELVISVQYENNALAWTLRNWEKTNYVRSLDSSASPDIIITEGLDQQPKQIAAYRGQDFVWTSRVNWEQLWPPNFFAWLLFRDATLEHSSIALWAREDLFPEQLGLETSVDGEGNNAFEAVVE